ncbi:MAG: arsenic resistance N-acetyltransferase ArsN2 [Salinivenus sp.]
MTDQADALRTARPEDLGAIRALLRTCDLPSEDLTPAHLPHFLVAPGDDGLRGCVGCEAGGDDALLRSLAVRPAARGEGLGGLLVDALERRARRSGIRALYLLTTTAASFFRRRGYEKIGREALPDPLQHTEEAACLCPASATCMRKPLGTATTDAPSSSTF